MASSSKVVYFAHGKESGPWGTKITRLAKLAKLRGFEVESPDYSGMASAQMRVEHLLALQPEASECLVLVGSSMGAYVATVASARLRPHGLFLMAPAFYVGEWAAEEPLPQAERLEIVHGWRDEIVPVENAIRFARKNGATLHLLEATHGLAEQLPALDRLFDEFLEALVSPLAADPRSAFELEQEAKFQRESWLQQKPRIPR